MDQKTGFCVEIQFEKGASNPSRIFRTMTGLIEAFQVVDSHLIGSIYQKIKPVILLEEIESGSIRTIFRYFFEQFNDDALKNLDWKPLVGQYLVKAKYLILNFLENRETISSIAEIDELRSLLLDAAKQTDVKIISCYQPISRRNLLDGTLILTEALKPLSEKDAANYITAEDNAKFNYEFSITSSSIEDLLVRETIINREILILKVKKPDFLGDSKWEFHSGKIIPAKIEDVGWLAKFQTQSPDTRILPGDSLKVKVDHSIRYGFDNELISEDYIIKEIVQVLPSPEQPKLFHPSKQPE